MIFLLRVHLSDIGHIIKKNIIPMCLRPRMIKNRSEFNLHGQREYIVVPCGHCPECVAQKKESILQRCYMEWQYIKDHCLNGFAFWSTLTYDPEHIPKDTLFDYTDCTKFFKRIRRALEYDGYDVDFKYIYVSELGDTTKRPHYHVIFFVHKGITFEKFEPYVRKLWQNGFTDNEYWHRQHILTDVRAIRYVIKYLDKQFGLADGSEISTKYRCSSNLGYYPDLYDYTKDINIPSAKGFQTHHIGSYFLNKMCFEYRRDSDNKVIKTSRGSYTRCISEFGIKWKIDHIDDILDTYKKSLMVKIQHLSSECFKRFYELLGNRSIDDFVVYSYFYAGRILGADAFQFDLNNPIEFLKDIYKYNREMVDIGHNKHFHFNLNDAYEKKFENFDLMISYLYDMDFKQTKDSDSLKSQASINRLKKFINNV